MKTGREIWREFRLVDGIKVQTNFANVTLVSDDDKVGIKAAETYFWDETLVCDDNAYVIFQISKLSFKWIPLMRTFYLTQTGTGKESPQIEGKVPIKVMMMQPTGRVD